MDISHALVVVNVTVCYNKKQKFITQTKLIDILISMHITVQFVNDDLQAMIFYVSFFQQMSGK